MLLLNEYVTDNITYHMTFAVSVMQFIGERQGKKCPSGDFTSGKSFDFYHSPRYRYIMFYNNTMYEFY